MISDYLDTLDRDELRARLAEALEDEDTSRSVLLAGGGALAAFGLTRLTPIGLVVAALGGGLVYLGTQRRSIADFGRDIGRIASNATEAGSIDVEKTVTVNRPNDEVYGFWRDFKNLQRFMKHIQSVEPIDERRSRWTAQLFQGAPIVAWEAETLDDVAGSRISWRSLPDSPIETSGTVRFEPVMGGRATEVRLVMEYRVPVGPAARILNPALESMVKEDLRRFKRLVETGDFAVAEQSGRRRKRERASGTLASDIASSADLDTGVNGTPRRRGNLEFE